MALGNADVEGAIGEGFHHVRHRATRGHGRGDTRDAPILLGQLHERMAEDVLIELRLVRPFGQEALAGILIEAPGRVPDGGGLLGGFVALAFLRFDVEQLGALHFLDVAQLLDQIAHVVAVDRPEVADAEALKEVVLAVDEGLEAVIEAQDVLAPIFGDEVQLEELLVDLVADVVVGLAGGDVDEVTVHAAHVAVDRHVVIVKHDQQVVGVDGGVVNALEGQSAGHGAVADDGHDVSAPLAGYLKGGGHAQSGRDGVRGVPSDEGIVGALFGVGESADAPELAEGVEGLASAGEYLVTISLMPDVPDDAVVGRVEDVMQGHGQLHGAEAGTEMSGSL